MKEAIKSVVRVVGSSMLDAVGLYDRQLASLLDEPGRFLVVMYHRVIDEPKDDINLDPFALGMCVRERHFTAQANYLKSRFNVMPLGELMSAVQHGEALPPASAAITFDDGYLDNLTHAAPVLKALDLPATFYVPTGGLEQGQAFWWDRMIAAVADTELAEIQLPELGLTDALPLSRLNKRDSLMKMLDAIWALSESALPAVVDEVVNKLVPGRSFRLAADARAPRMDIDQLKQLTAMGFEIGAHTVNHFDLRSLDADTANYEVTASRTDLEQLLGRPVRTFAYPSGFHDRALHSVVRDAGFDCALSTDRGVNCVNSGELNQYAVLRVGMPDTGVADFKRALSGAPTTGMGTSA